MRALLTILVTLLVSDPNLAILSNIGIDQALEYAMVAMKQAMVRYDLDPMLLPYVRRPIAVGAQNRTLYLMDMRVNKLTTIYAPQSASQLGSNSWRIEFAGHLVTDPIILYFNFELHKMEESKYRLERNGRGVAKISDFGISFHGDFHLRTYKIRALEMKISERGTMTIRYLSTMPATIASLVSDYINNDIFDEITTRIDAFLREKKNYINTLLNRIHTYD